MSGKYIHGHHASVLRSHSWRTVENSCPHLLPYLNNPSLKILDVGCGPGTITTDLALRVPEGLVLGIDPSAEVIEKARDYAEKQGVTNVRFEVGDIFSWQKVDGIEAASFDVVHAHQVLQHLTDPLGAMREFKKITKKDGIIAVRDSIYSAMTWYPELEGLLKWRNLYLAVAKSLNFDPNIGKRLHAVAMQAGFQRSDVEATSGTWTFSTPEEREFWCDVWAARTVKSDFKTRVLDSGLGTEADLESIEKTWRELQKSEYAWFAVVHGQVICHNRS